MPVLVIALLGLLVFGLVSVLLVIAMFVENRKKSEHEETLNSDERVVPSGKNAA
jgi:hypothetical protein